MEGIGQEIANHNVITCLKELHDLGVYSDVEYALRLNDILQCEGQARFSLSESEIAKRLR